MFKNNRAQYILGGTVCRGMGGPVYCGMCGTLSRGITGPVCAESPVNNLCYAIKITAEDTEKINRRDTQRKKKNR